MSFPEKTIESDASITVINAKCDAIQASVKEVVELVQDHADMDYRDKVTVNMSAMQMINWITDTRNRLLQVFVPEP